MMRRPVLLLNVLAIVLVSLLAACGDEETSLDPPEITYGEDISEMGMFVVDPRYTVATLPEDSEEWLLFDDIGEFFKYRGAHRDTGFQAMWVNDFHDEDWLKAEDAWYVESPEIKSPMGWGLAAFRNESDAETAAGEMGGTVLSWDDVQDRAWEMPPGPMSAGSTPESGATPVASPATMHTGH